MSKKPRKARKRKAALQLADDIGLAGVPQVLPPIRQRVTSWVLAYLRRNYSLDALTMDANLTTDLHLSPTQLPGLAIAFGYELEHNETWNVDLTKFSLGGTELNDAVLKKTLGDLISYITNKVTAAQRT
jgi:hypothetical protein